GLRRGGRPSPRWWRTPLRGWHSSCASTPPYGRSHAAAPASRRDCRGRQLAGPPPSAKEPGIGAEPTEGRGRSRSVQPSTPPGARLDDDTNGEEGGDGYHLG